MEDPPQPPADETSDCHSVGFVSSAYTPTFQFGIKCYVDRLKLLPNPDLQDATIEPRHDIENIVDLKNDLSSAFGKSIVDDYP